MQEAVHPFSKDALAQDWIHLSAVVRQIEIIGEAARRLSKEFRQAHSEIPWKKIVGMRDVLIYAYDDLEIDDIWETATFDIPDLLPKLQVLISAMQDKAADT